MLPAGYGNRSEVRKVNARQDVEITQWDVALEALAREESRLLGRPLRMEDFRRLARAHAIRLDDLMVTLFELAIQGEWIYRDAQGRQQAFDRETLDGLFVNRRLQEADLLAFTGSWEPVN